MPKDNGRAKRAKSKKMHKKALANIPQNSEQDKSNQRDVSLLEHNWTPKETKFGEEFKGKNRVIIS